MAATRARRLWERQPFKWFQRGSGRLWGACAQSDGGLALSRRGHVHPRSGFGHGRLCSTAYPPSGFPLGVFLWPSSLVFLFIPLAALVSSFCVIVFVCATLFRGRRQLPQAGEVQLAPQLWGLGRFALAAHFQPMTIPAAALSSST